MRSWVIDTWVTPWLSIACDCWREVTGRMMHASSGLPGDDNQPSSGPPPMSEEDRPHLYSEFGDGNDPYVLISLPTACGFVLHRPW